MTTTQFMRKGCLRSAVHPAFWNLGSQEAVRASCVVVIAAVGTTAVMQHIMVDLLSLHFFSFFVQRISQKQDRRNAFTGLAAIFSPCTYIIPP
jgi:predicted short-subunit dehydrogenase-like oxidoreductase (DUF2520 family)